MSARSRASTRPTCWLRSPSSGPASSASPSCPLPPPTSRSHRWQPRRTSGQVERAPRRLGDPRAVGPARPPSARVGRLAHRAVHRRVAPADIASTLAALPKVSIDHLGLSREGLPHLLRLAEQGVHVKATGFSRGDLDVPDALRQIARAHPGALVVGTDLPSTRASQRSPTLTSSSSCSRCSTTTWSRPRSPATRSRSTGLEARPSRVGSRWPAGPAARRRSAFGRRWRAGPAAAHAAPPGTTPPATRRGTKAASSSPARSSTPASWPTWSGSTTSCT